MGSSDGLEPLYARPLESILQPARHGRADHAAQPSGHGVLERRAGIHRPAERRWRAATATACRPKPNGNMPHAPARRRPIPSATTMPTWAATLGLGRTSPPAAPIPWGRRRPIPGASTMSTAMPGNGCRTGSTRTYYASSPLGRSHWATTGEQARRARRQLAHHGDQLADGVPARLRARLPRHQHRVPAAEGGGLGMAVRSTGLWLAEQRRGPYTCTGFVMNARAAARGKTARSD